MMHELARVGFTQSYTYFTWRNGKDELRGVRRASWSTPAHYMRPNFFVNTPDILHELPAARRAGACSRSGPCWPSMLSPTWGVYSGLRAVRAPAGAPGQRGVPRLARSTSCGRATSPAPRPTAGRSRRSSRRLNEIRREHPALHWLRNLRFHHDRQRRDHWHSASATTTTTGDTVLVVCSTDPHDVREGWTSLDLPALGVDWDDALRRRTTCSPAPSTSGASTTTSGSTRTSSPAHILAVRRQSECERHQARRRVIERRTVLTER